MVVNYNDIINAIAKAEDVALYNARSRAIELSNGCKPSAEANEKAIEIESWIQILTRAAATIDQDTCLDDDIIWEIIQNINEQNREVDCDVSRTYSKHASSGGGSNVPSPYVEAIFGIGLRINNTNRSKPIIEIYFDPSTISGDGTEADPYSAIGGGGGATNLGYTASPTNGIVTSDTGTDATIPLADGTNAGLLKPAKFTVLENTSGTNTGDNATNTTSNTYADGKVADAINNGTTTIAPSQNAVFDALALLKIEEINLQDIGTALPASTYTFVLEAKYARTINELTVDAGAGTCTLTMNINGTPVTGISAVSVSTTKATYTATAANSIAINDLVTIVTSSNSGLENLQITVKTTRV